MKSLFIRVRVVPNLFYKFARRTLLSRKTHPTDGTISTLKCISQLSNCQVHGRIYWAHIFYTSELALSSHIGNSRNMKYCYENIIIFVQKIFPL